jgi:hypothetical protein
MSTTAPEKWRDVPGMEGRYAISSRGRVIRRGGRYPRPARIIGWRHQYGRVELVGADGRHTTRSVKRIMRAVGFSVDCRIPCVDPELLPGEEWRTLTLPGFTHYAVSNLGRVRRTYRVKQTGHGRDDGILNLTSQRGCVKPRVTLIRDYEAERTERTARIEDLMASVGFNPHAPVKTERGLRYR